MERHIIRINEDTCNGCGGTAVGGAEVQLGITRKPITAWGGMIVLQAARCRSNPSTPQEVPAQAVPSSINPSDTPLKPVHPLRGLNG